MLDLQLNPSSGLFVKTFYKQVFEHLMYPEVR